MAGEDSGNLNIGLVSTGVCSPMPGSGNRWVLPPRFPSMRDRLPKHWPDILAFAAVGFAWLGVTVYTF